MAFTKKDKGSKRKLAASAARSARAKVVDVPSKSLKVDDALLIKASNMLSMIKSYMINGSALLIGAPSFQNILVFSRDSRSK